MTFEEVLPQLRTGARATRGAWGVWEPFGRWIAIMQPTESDSMQQPFLYKADGEGKLTPWALTNESLFADDWAII